MHSTGMPDADNVNERVIVDAADNEIGTWAISVWANDLTTDDVQSYSVVVNGAISPATGDAPEASESSSITAPLWSISTCDVRFTCACTRRDFLTSNLYRSPIMKARIK